MPLDLYARSKRISDDIAEGRTQRRQQRNDAAAMNALSSGDVSRAAAYNPQMASEYLGVTGAQQEQQAAAQERKRNLALDATRAFRQATARGATPEDAVQQLAPAFSKFASPDEVNEFFSVLAQNPDRAQDIEAALAGSEPEDDKRTAAIREYEYLQTLNPKERELYFENKRNPQTFELGGARYGVTPGSGGQQTNQLITPEETARGERTVEEAKSIGKEVPKAVAADLDKKYAEAQAATETLSQAAYAKNLLDEGIIAGSLPGQRQALSRAMSTITGREMSSESINTSVYRSLVGKFVAQAITAFGAGTGLSDKDREFAEAMSGGDLAAGAKALREIMDIVEKQSRRKIENYETRRSGVVKRYSDYGDLYPSFQETAPGAGDEAPDDIYTAADAIIGGL